MSSTRHRPSALDLEPRTTAFMPLAEGAALRVEMSAGCEQFVGRFARIDDFRFGDGIIRFRSAAL